MNEFTSHTWRVLVTDDEAHIRTPIVKALRSKSFIVEEAVSGNHALNLLEKQPYDVMILDMCMPGLAGVDVMKSAKKIQPDISLIVLTGHATVESAISAVKLNADDYFMKPSSVHQILSRVEEIISEKQSTHNNEQIIGLMSEALDLLKVQHTSDSLPSTEPIPNKQILERNPLIVDRVNRTAKFVDEPEVEVELSKGETAVLVSLMKNANNVVSCQQLVRLAWQYDTDYVEATSVIRPYISRLRQKLNTKSDTNDLNLIRTLRKRGYMFISDT